MELLARGSDADVFALDPEWVLRRYRDGADATAEAATMALVRSRGFPVPEVRSARGPDLVLRRVAGPTLWEAIGAGLLRARRAGALLRELHDSLHAIGAADDAGRIVHLDLHPANVLLPATGPVVIDWRNARHGIPATDVALTAVIVAQVAVRPDDPRRTAARSLLAAFLERSPDLAAGLPAALALRRADPNLPAPQREQVDRARDLILGSIGSAPEA